MSGRSAGIGAAAGSLGGGVYKGLEADANYKSAERNCMRGPRPVADGTTSVPILRAVP